MPDRNIPRQLTLSLLQSSLDGFCEATDTGPSNCKTGHKGAWTLPFHLRATLETSGAPWVGAAQWCLARCAGCSRCAFVSVSLKYTECDWFSRCDTARLHLSPAGFRTMPFTRDAGIVDGSGGAGGSSSSVGGGSGGAGGGRGRGNASIRSRGRSAFELLSGAHDRLDGAAARLHSQPWQARELPDSDSLGQPLLLVGLISGSMARRELARCTWGGVLARMGGGMRVKFLVAARAEDAGAPHVERGALFGAAAHCSLLFARACWGRAFREPGCATHCGVAMRPGRLRRFRGVQPPGAADTLAVPVEEHQGVAGGGGLMPARNAVGSWSQYVKLVYFLRYALGKHPGLSGPQNQPARASQQKLATRGSNRQVRACTCQVRRKAA